MRRPGELFPLKSYWIFSGDEYPFAGTVYRIKKKEIWWNATQNKENTYFKCEVHQASIHYNFYEDCTYIREEWFIEKYNNGTLHRVVDLR